MNLKPFNLKRALAGDPVIDDEGNKYVQILYANKADQEIYTTRVMAIQEDGTMRFVNEDGENKHGGFKLFMAPTTKTYYANVYKDLNNQLKLGQVLVLEPGCIVLNKNETFVKTISFELEI